jgi:hypothetical protein
MVEIEVRLLPDSILPHSTLPITIPPGFPISFGKPVTNGEEFPVVYGSLSNKQYKKVDNPEDIEFEFGQLTIYLNPDNDIVAPDDEWITVPIKVKVPRGTQRLRSQLDPVTRKRHLNKGLW